MKGHSDATDPGPDQAPPTQRDTGRSAHPQPQDSADMVFRTTATRNTQIRWLTREGLLEELDLLIFACRRKPEAKAKVARFARASAGTPNWTIYVRSPALPAHVSVGSDPARLRYERQG